MKKQYHPVISMHVTDNKGEQQENRNTTENKKHLVREDTRTRSEPCVSLLLLLLLFRKSVFCLARLPPTGLATLSTSE